MNLVSLYEKISALTNFETLKIECVLGISTTQCSRVMFEHFSSLCCHVCLCVREAKGCCEMTKVPRHITTSS